MVDNQAGISGRNAFPDVIMNILNYSLFDLHHRLYSIYTLRMMKMIKYIYHMLRFPININK